MTEEGPDPGGEKLLRILVGDTETTGWVTPSLTSVPE